MAVVEVVDRTSDASLEGAAGNVRSAGELDSDQVVAGYSRRVRELMLSGRHLAALQLSLGRTVDRHRQSSRTRLRRVNDELAPLICTRTTHGSDSNPTPKTQLHFRLRMQPTVGQESNPSN